MDSSSYSYGKETRIKNPNPENISFEIYFLYAGTGEDEYEKSTNQVIQTNKQHNSVGSLQDYDNSDMPNSPEICSARKNVKYL